MWGVPSCYRTSPCSIRHRLLRVIQGSDSLSLSLVVTTPFPSHAFTKQSIEKKRKEGGSRIYCCITTSIVNSKANVMGTHNINNNHEASYISSVDFRPAPRGPFCSHTVGSILIYLWRKSTDGICNAITNSKTNSRAFLIVVNVESIIFGC